MVHTSFVPSPTFNTPTTIHLNINCMCIYDYFTIILPSVQLAEHPTPGKREIDPKAIEVSRLTYVVHKPQ